MSFTAPGVEHSGAVKERGEPLVDLRDEQVIRVDPRLAGPAGAYGTSGSASSTT
jgi:hypothetical protein